MVVDTSFQALRPALQSVAEERDGQYCEGGDPLAWFDGFWDFVERERSMISSCRCSVVVGKQFPWMIACFVKSLPDREDVARGHVFVEAKDYRPEAYAPWPVQHIYLHDGTPFTRPACSARFVGAEPLVRAASLGLSLEFGYWGVHLKHLDWLSPEMITREQLLGGLDIGMQVVEAEIALLSGGGTE